MKFLISLALLTASLLATVYLGSKLNLFPLVPSFWLEIILFLSLSTGILFRFLLKFSNSPSFTLAYLLSVVLKMLGYGAFILTIIVVDKSAAVGNAVLFLVAYLIFSALEVGFLFNKINRVFPK